MKRLLLWAVVASAVAYGFVSLSAQSCSPSNYTGLSNTAPIPSNFCPYTEAPFRNRLPENPENINATETANLQAIHTYYTGIYGAAGDPNSRVIGVIGSMPTNPEGNAGCVAGVTFCMGDSGYSIWIAGPLDPLVSIDCDNVTYGCSNQLASPSYPVATLPSFRIPANYRPSCSHAIGFCDRNGQIIQPDGTSIAMYGCWPNRNFANGDVLSAPSGGPCPGGSGLNGANYSSVLTSTGINAGNVNGGDDFLTTIVKVHEVNSGQINHALSVLLHCGHGPAIYPGSGAGTCSDLGIPLTGLQWGSRIFLDRTRAQIDAMIAIGDQPAHMRAFLYAAHEYGVYVFDGGGGMGLNQPWLENPTAIVLNGAANPWASWFGARGVTCCAADGQIKAGDGIVWPRLAPYLKVLDGCYATDTCSDSGEENPTTPSPATGTTTTTDSFTGTAGTALTAHTGEAGAGWSLRTGSSAGWVITDANRIRLNTVGSDTYTCVSGPPLSAQYDLNIDWRVFSLPGQFYSLLLKASTTEGTDIRLTYDVAGATFYWQRVTTGTGTLLDQASYTLTVGQTYSISIRARSAEMGVFINGTNILHTTDATFGATVGRVCVGGYAGTTADTNTTGIHMDSLTVVDEETGSTGPAPSLFPPTIRVRTP